VISHESTDVSDNFTQQIRHMQSTISHAQTHVSDNCT